MDYAKLPPSCLPPPGALSSEGALSSAGLAVAEPRGGISQMSL